MNDTEFPPRRIERLIDITRGDMNWTNILIESNYQITYAIQPNNNGQRVDLVLKIHGGAFEINGDSAVEAATLEEIIYSWEFGPGSAGADSVSIVDVNGHPAPSISCDIHVESFHIANGWTVQRNGEITRHDPMPRVRITGDTRLFDRLSERLRSDQHPTADGGLLRVDLRPFTIKGGRIIF